MGWSVGYDSSWNRDIGYGVPAYCDHPGCGKEINRGLSYVCGGDPYGGDRGCGLYFCGDHLRVSARLPQLCAQCRPSVRHPFKPTPDHPDWIKYKLTDVSWAEWREQNKDAVSAMIRALEVAEGPSLSAANPHLRDPVERARQVRNTVESSSAIERGS